MSLVPGFAPDALSEWLELDFELQESVWDALEDFLNRPHRDEEQTVIEVFRDAGSVRHYLFVRVTLNSSRRRATVVGVAHVQLQAP